MGAAKALDEVTGEIESGERLLTYSRLLSLSVGLLITFAAPTL